jgi:hypothetical protein
MKTKNVDRKCFACGSTSLQYGTIGAHRHTFIPEKKTMWVGYDIRAYVCLDCGTVGEYLQDRDIDKLRDAQAKKE